MLTINMSLSSLPREIIAYIFSLDDKLLRISHRINKTVYTSVRLFAIHHLCSLPLTKDEVRQEYLHDTVPWKWKRRATFHEPLFTLNGGSGVIIIDDSFETFYQYREVIDDQLFVSLFSTTDWYFGIDLSGRYCPLVTYNCVIKRLNSIECITLSRDKKHEIACDISLDHLRRIKEKYMNIDYILVLEAFMLNIRGISTSRAIGNFVASVYSGTLQSHIDKCEELYKQIVKSFRNHEDIEMIEPN